MWTHHIQRPIIRIPPRTPRVSEIAPESSAPPMNITRFLCLLTVCFLIYILSCLFLVQFILPPALLLTAFAYISNFFLTLIIGLFFSTSIILPCLILAFTASRISSFIQTFLDAPNPSPSLLDYCFEIQSLLIEYILTTVTFTPRLTFILFPSLLKSVLYVVQDSSCLLRFLRVLFPTWSFVRSYFNPYAYAILYELPNKFAHSALLVIKKPWTITHLLVELMRCILLLIRIPVNKLGEGVSWIGRGRMRVKTGGVGNFDRGPADRI
ncbi:hypothetical protein BGX38DRAFT_203542 [Terfezia claveryi]|nr:hypothetical protein BGX38DRAFT_203542 [Terfezia claveryi]